MNSQEAAREERALRTIADAARQQLTPQERADLADAAAARGRRDILNLIPVIEARLDALEGCLSAEDPEHRLQVLEAEVREMRAHMLSLGRVTRYLRHMFPPAKKMKCKKGARRHAP